ncbi:HAD family hydrolase [Marinococcus luteus]|uniref:HAD family hydrolase n=1 Tax=Marinococcus luteus TaxID=1122204 RepID=UPI002ACCF6D1|nr:HAD family hydrolase [Marinococcus luteus]MDZ5783103.1 HAD family hydrolase [Marinococcus luteus]
MATKVVLFDLDQTLLDKQKTLAVFSEYQHTQFALHRYADLGTFQNSFVSLNNQLLPKAVVYQEIGRKCSIPEVLLGELLQHLNERLPEFSEGFPGLHNMLAILNKENYKIGIITNGRDFYQRHKITSLAIEQYMDLIVTSDQLNIRKPNPQIFQYALDYFQIQAVNTVFIGDDLKADISPAKKLGMLTIHKTTDSSSSAHASTNCLEDITRIIETLAEYEA